MTHSSPTSVPNPTDVVIIPHTKRTVLRGFAPRDSDLSSACGSRSRPKSVGRQRCL